MTIGIYCIALRSTEEVLWVGQSINLEKRWLRHTSDLLKGTHSQKDFSSWFKEGGFSKFDLSFSILEECSPEELNEKEWLWFEGLSPKFFGQRPSSSRKWYLSEETKRKISESHRSRVEAMRKSGQQFSIWNLMSPEQRELKSKRNAENGFDSKSGRIAGKMNANLPKTEGHKKALAESALKASREIISCQLCEKRCKGKAAFARHTKAKHSPA